MTVLTPQRERVRFDSPGAVVQEIETVYDEIAELQVGHIEAPRKSRACRPG
jgi:hypothetical protein